MKAFEEWWSKFDCCIEPCGDDCNFQSCIVCEEIAEIAWKAALEWADTHSDKHCCFQDCFVNIAIKKELEES